MIEYIIKVIEPKEEQIKKFTGSTLDSARQKAQEHLWSCPEGTKYIYLNTRIINDTNI